MFVPTTEQLLAHVIGDYVLQSEWMAINKVKSTVAAMVHATVYTLPFLFLTQNLSALAIILGTHFLIDRLSLARYLVWLHNLLSPPSWWYSWKEAKENFGARKTTPAFLAVWLLIIMDNTLHVVINAMALSLFA